jgi:hypothetical protein
MMHRLVRMVCVFFATLVRLRNFNIKVSAALIFAKTPQVVKPRVSELRRFATQFALLKEASNLYQATLQLDSQIGEGH